MFNGKCAEVGRSNWAVWWKGGFSLLALQILHALLTHHIVVLLRYHLCRHFLILSLQAQINRIKLRSIADVNSVSARLEFHLCTPWLGTMHNGQTNLPIYVVLSGLDWVRVTSLDSGYLLSQNIILFDHATHAIQCCGTHTSQAAKLCNLSGGTPTHAASSTLLLLLFNSNKYFIILASSCLLLLGRAPWENWQDWRGACASLLLFQVWKSTSSSRSNQPN